MLHFFFGVRELVKIQSQIRSLPFIVNKLKTECVFDELIVKLKISHIPIFNRERLWLVGILAKHNPYFYVLKFYLFKKAFD